MHHAIGDTRNATTRCTRPCCHYSRFTHYLVQVVESEQGDDSAAEGVGNGDRARDNSTRTSVVVRAGHSYPAAAARKLGPRVAVAFGSAHPHAVRISVSVTHAVGTARQP